MLYRKAAISVIIWLTFVAPCFADPLFGSDDVRTYQSHALADTQDTRGVILSDTLRLTLPMAEELFLKKNLTLIAARYRLTTSEADLVAAKLLPNPQLSLNASFVNVLAKPVDYSAAQTTYRIDQLIELGGKRGKRIDVASHAVESAKADFQNTLFQLISDVKEGFLETAFAERLYLLADSSYQIFKKSVEVAQVRLKTGDIGEAELKKLELAQLDYQENLSAARQNLTEARSKLRQMLNLPPALPLKISYDFKPALTLPDKDTLTAVALSSRADLASLRERTLMQQNRIDLAHANAIPDITFGVELDRQGPDFKNTFGGGIGIAIPIFSRNQDEIQRAEAESQAAEADQKAKENSIANDVNAAYEKYRDSWSIVQSFSSSTLDYAEEVRAMEVKSYNAGNISLIDFLETERIYNDAAHSYYDAIQKFLDNQIELERIVGEEIFSKSILSGKEQ